MIETVHAWQRPSINRPGDSCRGEGREACGLVPNKLGVHVIVRQVNLPVSIMIFFLNGQEGAFQPQIVPRIRRSAKTNKKEKHPGFISCFNRTIPRKSIRRMVY